MSDTIPWWPGPVEPIFASHDNVRRHQKTTIRSTCGLVAMTSASHAEGRQFDPGLVYALRLVPKALATAAFTTDEFNQAR